MINFNIVWIIATFQGILLAFFLLLRNDRKINIPLILFLTLTSIDLFLKYFYESRLIYKYPYLLYISEPFNMLCGVLLYFYARNIYFGKPTFKRTDIMFLLPAFIYFLYYLPIYLSKSYDRLKYINDFYNLSIYSYENLYEWIAEIIVNVPFLFMSIKKLNQLDLKVKNNYSDISKISYINLRNLICFIIILYFWEIITIILAILNVQIVYSFDTLIYIFMIVIMYMIGYDALVRKSNLVMMEITPYYGIDISEIQTDKSEKLKITKYQKNNLSETKISQIAEKIINTFEKDKIYRNPELKLYDLSKSIEENPNYVSIVLNNYFQKNFYDFVNFYRVEEAKKLLKLPEFQNYTITAIGFEVGFNSKTAFHNAFKKFTGMTPLQYQKL
jgi:AraC-like DNA-binding protein